MASSINASTSGAGGIITTADNTGNLNIQSGGSTVLGITSSGVTVTGSLTANGVVASPYSMKNRIINGAMVIDQRNAGASTTPTGSTYTLDRWRVLATQSSKFSVQQNAGSVTPPAGFKNYLGITSLSAYTVTTGDNFSIQQKIEGYNVADLGYGASGASTVTLSFWVRSSLTGTFGGVFCNENADQGYIFSYTINSANTWEQKTVTVSGDTTGTWVTTTGVGLDVRFNFGSGSDKLSTAGSWSGTVYNSVTGQTSVVGTNGATFYITGVQLEVGSTATAFEWRPYGMELVLCQRYYQKIKSTSGGGVETIEAWPMCCISATSASLWYPFPVTMRSAPTGSYTGVVNTDFQVYSAGSYRTLSGIPNLSPLTPYGSRIDMSSSSNFTSGYAAALYLQTTTASFSFSAEL